MIPSIHGIIQSGGQVVPALPLPGDYGTGCYVAYSLRKVVDAYTGAVALIRRSSDNALQAFTETEITDGTLAAFVGGGDGFVHTLYDQKGKTDYNLIQTNVAAQPIIMESGVLYTENGKPAMKFTGTQFIGNATAAFWVFLHYYNSSVFSVQKVAGVNPDNIYAIWATGQSVSGSRVAYLSYDDRSSVPRNNQWVHVIGASGVVSLNTLADAFVTEKLITARMHGIPRIGGSFISNRAYGGVDSDALVNVNTSTGTAQSSPPTHGLRLGDANGGWKLVGSISEIVIYTALDNLTSFIDLDTDVDTAMKTHYSIN